MAELPEPARRIPVVSSRMGPVDSVWSGTVLNGGLLGNGITAGNNGGGQGAALENNITVDATNGGIIDGGGIWSQRMRLTGTDSPWGRLPEKCAPLSPSVDNACNVPTFSRVKE